jgi:hypothetical protein
MSEYGPGWKGNRTKNNNASNVGNNRTATGGYQKIDSVTSGSVSKVEKNSKPMPMSEAGYEKTFRDACHNSGAKIQRQLPPYDTMKRNNY